MAGAVLVGLWLRFVIRDWTMIFRPLAQREDPELEEKLEKQIVVSRYVAYVYWISIASAACVGAVKPF